MTEYGARELAAAIVAQAVKDYQSAKRKPRNNTERLIYYRTRKECMLFFRSEWFQNLADIDPEKLIKRIKTQKVNFEEDL